MDIWTSSQLRLTHLDAIRRDDSSVNQVTNISSPVQTPTTHQQQSELQTTGDFIKTTEFINIINLPPIYFGGNLDLNV